MLRTEILYSYFNTKKIPWFIRGSIYGSAPRPSNSKKLRSLSATIVHYKRRDFFDSESLLTTTAMPVCALGFFVCVNIMWVFVRNNHEINQK